MTRSLVRATLFVVVCQGSDCKKAGSKTLARTARRVLKAQGALRRGVVLKTRCTGHCKRAAVCGVLPAGEWLEEADDAALEALILRHLERA